MCGIFCILSPEASQSLLAKFKIFEENIKKRGPNALNTQLITTTYHNILFAASILWLQGQDMTIQPINDDSTFIYNGDIFGGSSPDSRHSIGDTLLIYNILNSSSCLVQSLEGLKGPYAFIFLNKNEEKLFFARDYFGRRSLLLGKSQTEIIITSVAKKHTEYDFIELPAIGIFSICLKTGNFQLFPWKTKNSNFQTKLEEVESFLNKTIVVNSTIDTNKSNNNNFQEPNNSDLEIFKDIALKPNIFETLLNNSTWLENVLKLQHLLEHSINQRISTQPSFCSNCFNNYNCNHATTAILFSGGIDCAILALLTSKILTKSQRPIDLINVAFDRSKTFQTPDRITGLETLNELKNIQPSTNWNFVPVNVTTNELNQARSERISHLIYPLNSILDDSLGCALWFASRGQNSSYTSQTRVLLVGMGADELFGGYTRHRAALQNHNWAKLNQVLDEDWQNLPHRNLARDDRVVSDHGKQLRTPYLDEDVVSFVRKLPPWSKTFPSKDLPQGIGEKILLRSLGYHLGLHKASTYKKRALQFGSRIADPKEKAHEKSDRL